MSVLLTRKINDKKIVWFQNSNSYLILDNIVSKIIEKFNLEMSTESIFEWTQKQIDVPNDTLKKFINDIEELYNKNNKEKEQKEEVLFKRELDRLHFTNKYYLINNVVFFIQYENEYLEAQIHPIFAHLETTEPQNYEFHYQVFEEENLIIFIKDDLIIGSWKKSESHVFQGKLSMQILIDIYKKPEEKWMGVFHASALSNGKDSMLFLGDSGNGKSTSLALLSANGYDCIADDFVPIDSEKKVFTYPAAISIKKNSVTTLLPFYPELESSAEFHFKKLNKVVRFLPPKNLNYDLKLPCKALIFIKYNSNIELKINKISKIEAFQKLIPDSWISPAKKNATIFLDWFLELPCYQLVYSNNKKMIESVSKIFNDEL